MSKKKEKPKEEKVIHLEGKLAKYKHIARKVAGQPLLYEETKDGTHRLKKINIEKTGIFGCVSYIGRSLKKLTKKYLHK